MNAIYALILFIISSNLYSQEVLNFKAQYKIPVTNPEHEQFSVFELKSYTVVNNGKDSKISYELPFAMTGVSGQVIELSLVIEKLPMRVFEGPRATALCEGAWAKMKCSIRLKALSMHYGRIERALQKEGVPTFEIEGRLKMLRAFAGEPIGETAVMTE